MFEDAFPAEADLITNMCMSECMPINIRESVHCCIVYINKKSDIILVTFLNSLKCWYFPLKNPSHFFSTSQTEVNLKKSKLWNMN